MNNLEIEVGKGKIEAETPLSPPPHSLSNITFLWKKWGE